MSSTSKTAAVGITALLVIAVLVALNFLVGGVGFGNFRVDLTQDGLYTLSPGTKNILGRINPDEPVTIRFFATNDDRVMPNVLKPHARTIEDLLLEFEKQGGGNVALEVIHPNPDTDDEDKAKEDEVRGMQVNQEGDNIYLGMTIKCLDKKEVLPFLSPDDATALEYEVSRAINKVLKQNKTVVGLMSALPVGGSPMFPFQRQRGQEPWAIIQQIKADYEVRDVPVTTDKIDPDITVLLVIHPADITETAEFAIDQYLLGGGNVVALVDPQSLLSQAYSGQQNPMTGQPGAQINGSSDLNNLFKAWGIGYKRDMITADMNYRGMIQGRVNPTALQIPAKGINNDSRFTSGLQSLTFMGAGSFSVEKKEGLDAITLANSSEASELIDTAAAEKLRREDLTNFNASGKKQILAVHLKGKFKTAFPKGRPQAPGAKESGGAEQDATKPAAAASSDAPAPAVSATTAPAAPVAEAKKEEKKDDSLKESKDSERSVVLFADSDMLYDAFCLRQGDLGVGLVANGGNLPMLLNTIEVLAGGGDLIQVRNRKSPIRPFSKLKEMRESVEEKFRPKLISLEAERQKIADSLSKARPQLDMKKGALLIDPKTMNDIKEMEKNSRSIEREVREIRKEVNKEVERNKSWLKWLNVFAVPKFLLLYGVIAAYRRRTLTAAA
jgi:ABC-type uncharacterized transport system involved in gliding motility auxiliary subunit